MQDFQGTEGYCSDDQAIVLSGADCIQMFNMIIDENGDTVQLAYRRSTSNEVERVGYSEGNYEGQYSVDFGSKGCMTGYNLGFSDPAPARNLAVA